MIKNPYKALHYHKGNYFNYGTGQDLYIYDGFTNNSKSGVYKGSYELPSKYELNGGKCENFTISFLEVYQIDF